MILERANKKRRTHNLEVENARAEKKSHHQNVNHEDAAMRFMRLPKITYF